MTPNTAEEPIPNDLDECIIHLKNKIPSEDLKAFGDLPERRAGGIAHHGLEQHLRNTWGLWTGSSLKSWFEERGIWHADDMSDIILDSLHRDLNGEPIRFEEQIESYRQYWMLSEKLKKDGSARLNVQKDGNFTVIKEDE